MYPSVQVNLPIVGPLTLAQLISLALVVVGLWVLLRRPREETEKLSAGAT